MSHAMGALKFQDGVIGFFEYNGTSDVVVSHHYETTKEVNDNWRDSSWLSCTCGKEEPVSLFSSYGGGFYIAGIACKDCGSVNTIDNDFDMIERHSCDDWAKTMLDW